ncbi:FAD-dependent oxidoreductase [Alteromonadaceae bacterium BrNp21-10]|nr:FAD-dependent oxidoreductase [Alteromonadaceae bacterium BrNp21-10]
MKQGLSRRECLFMLAKIAGSSAAIMHAAEALGIPQPVSSFNNNKLKKVSGKRPHVLILGAGISALVSAYELSRAGYSCEVLEASSRIGGRNMTLRHGDVIDEIGNRQICDFDDEPNLYFNAGPARLPAHHHGILHYCRELGVQLQVFNNYNRNCYTQDDNVFDGKPIRIGEYEADIQGFTNELLAKSLRHTKHLDAPFDESDFERMLQYVKTQGALDNEFKYQGSTLSGWQSGGVFAPGKMKTPRGFADLLKSNFWAGGMIFTQWADQEPAMMTPVGGMDSIVKHFLPHVQDKIKLNAQVQRIQNQDHGVDVQYMQHGQLKTTRGDYCLNCIPSEILSGIDHNFPDDYSHMMAKMHRGKLIKFGLQAKERFWEKDDIYNGISWTNQDITQIWYPEHGIFAKKGVLLGGYSWVPEIVDRFAAMSSSQRIESVLAQGEKIHPQYRQYIEKGVSICWHRMNHQLGCGTLWDDEHYAAGFELLQKPTGRHYLMGDQMALLEGWQEGAVQSAWYAMQDIEKRQSHKSGVSA